MLAFIELESCWTVHERMIALGRESYEKLRIELDGSLPITEWKDGADKPPSAYLSGEYLIELTTDGPVLARHGFGFSVKRFKGAYFPGGRQKPNDVGPAAPSMQIQVAISNIGLLAIDEVIVLEDACTDSLQGYLRDGWRIIAVCPPNSVRRPDYVLGRSTTGARI